MGYLADFEFDLFISYAHVDNDPLIEGKGKHGWVDFFEDLLRNRLRVKLSKDVNFFRDPKLRNYGEFTTQLEECLARSAVMVCVLSPGYVDSPWCHRELSRFLDLAGKDRIIKVVKTVYDESTVSLDFQKTLQEIQNVLDVRFYEKDERSGRVRDLQPEIMEADIAVCVLKVDEIAQNLTEILKKLAAVKTLVSAPSAVGTSKDAGTVREDERVTIYLAEPSTDLVEKHNSIRSELQQFDYRVLPANKLPKEDGQEYIAAVQKCLQEAKISLHLLGEKYGVRPEGEERSITHIQYDLASESSKKTGLYQIVWAPQDLAPKDRNQQEFIEMVRNNSLEFLQTTLEDVKTILQRKIQSILTNGNDADGLQEGAPLRVCLVCDKRDVDSLKTLYSHLVINEKLDVKVPMEDERSAQKHRQLLRDSDAVILCYGIGDSGWFANIWKLTQKCLSTGRSKPLVAKAIYAGPPPTPEKEMLEFDDPMVFKDFTGFKPQTLEPFLKKLKAPRQNTR